MESVKKFQRNAVIVLLLIASFFGGHYYGKRGYEIEIKRNIPIVEITNRHAYPEEVDFALFWEVWEQVRSRHLDRPINPQDMVYGAISGMVNSIGDPYTSFLDPGQNEVVMSGIEGKYQGIGAELGLRDGQLIIVAPLDGSPAKEAGVMPGDKILEIEGESTIGISLTEAVSKIRGDEGTISTLTLQRGTDEPFEVEIRRGVITIESVTWEDKGDGVVYIRIGRFGSETNSSWDQVVRDINLKMLELDTIILDVRGNPGGYMDSAVYVSAEFLARGDVALYQESDLGKLTEHRDNRSGLFERIPAIYVLIDRGSASASEILALALKENLGDIVTVVGENSFGKGTIQDAKDFRDGSGLHITVAKWLSPDKNWVHEIGVEPDVEVERTTDDFAEGRDPQLDKVFELIGE